MTASPRQLVLDLAHRQALGAEDFLVSNSNAAAVEMIDAWPRWPHPASFVAGPQGSGKSHLANVWRLRSGAGIVSAAELSDTLVASLPDAAAIVVEDIDRGIADEKVLFHLLNRARESKLSVLLTSRVPPGEQEFHVPDLRSRLRALPMVEVQPPDEALLKAVLVKLFDDRQLYVEPQVIDYLSVRMERSMAAASNIVADIDRLALATHRKVTRPLAAQVLAAMGESRE
ncbi:Chromosomal replication initiator protein DnaA domain-containing protein [Hyphomicrobium sp. 1Nfss2.1]|uniref:HdaA/DnaA family protein n=1 Tax=Hyphomicrobium sp. 1Nfss2.1 TaxID=3413936 RepID=UPI003C7C2914